MIDVLIWAVSLVFSTGLVSGGAVLIVRMIEHNRSKEIEEGERTKRQGMQNAFLIEADKLDIRREELKLRPELETGGK